MAMVAAAGAAYAVAGGSVTGASTAHAATAGAFVEVHQAGDTPGDIWSHDVTDPNVGGQPGNFAGSVRFASGINPSVTHRNFKTVEVQELGNSAHDLVYRVGLPIGASTGWFAQHAYGNGTNPYVAMNNSGEIVEIHADNGNLDYTVGYLTGGNIAWGDTHQIASMAPMGLALSDPVGQIEYVVVEYASGSNIAHKVGRLVGTDVEWNGSDANKDGTSSMAVGNNPSITFRPNSGNLLEVYENNGALFYRTGDATGNPTQGYGVRWNKSPASYDNGFNPSVTIDSANNAIEVHQGQMGGGSLWSRMASVGNSQTAPTTVSWSYVTNYDGGINPVIG